MVPEQHVVVDADAALQGEHYDGEAAEEHAGSPGWPGAGRMTAGDPDDAPEVERGGEDDGGRDDRGELPLGEHGLKAERGKHATSFC